MLCKKCGKKVEPSYEQIGKCENCFVDNCGGLDPDAYEDKHKSTTISAKEALAMSVVDLGLCERVINILCREGILFVGDLVKKTETDLKAKQMLGEKSILEIKGRLKLFGLSLKPVCLTESSNLKS